MEVTTEMYTKLFNAITDIEKELTDIVTKLKLLQLETEEIYTSNEKPDM